MILYGILVRSAALGSTDGFNLPPPSFFGFAVEGHNNRLLVYSLTMVMAIGTAMALHRFVNSPCGVIGEAILTNEIRVEYLGTSVTGVLHFTYVIGATTAGLGGALIAIAAGHIDPDPQSPREGIAQMRRSAETAREPQNRAVDPGDHDDAEDDAPEGEPDLHRRTSPPRSAGVCAIRSLARVILLLMILVGSLIILLNLKSLKDWILG